MSMKDVVVIDYGLNNLLSVRRALEHCGARVIITHDREVILNASYVVLPGVGAFGRAMKALHELGLVDVIRLVAKRDIPLLGICLGMQLLLTESDEFGRTQGLDLISGRVVALPEASASGEAQKIPHIGWSELMPLVAITQWQGTLLEKMQQAFSVYFVHSFMANLDDEEDGLAVCQYGEKNIMAVIARGNIMGCQFHPEKSGEVGLNVLRQFLFL
jgi:imidazole glycerol-phosphate synthase subunit HisH